ncbi:efflux RND transporter permease subunit [Mycoplasmatota bacterium]|nr:efflux RND transporter permease subunit [Mycoplasmatota bacterium]
MKISEYSVRKPITVLMGILMLIVVGVFSLSQLSLELMPDINLPFAAVVTSYEGANPYEVEEDVTKNIESSLMGVSNFKNINSTSSEHFSMVIIEFSQSTNMDTAFLEMREKLDMISFPDGVGNPSIMKFDPSMMPVMVTSITRDFEDEESPLILTSEWIKRDLYNQLESIDGVASIDLNGASDTVLELALDSDKVNSYGLTDADVLRIIESQNIEGLIGVAPDGENIKMLYLGNNIEGISELEQVPIYYDENTEEVIRLVDLADEIKFINQSTNSYNKVNGKDAVTVAFFKQSDVGITDVVSNIQEKLDDITGSEEVDAEYVEILNQGDYIEQSVGSITNNLLIGAAVAIFILFLFLRDIRPTITVALSIPISIVGAFLLMYFSGVTLNMISMGGLALGIGMLVDNSIVVIENIYRLLNEGYDKKTAAIEGAKQVGVAITASTLTTVMVFIPVLFIENMIADIFVSMALTVTFSLLASLAIALTLVPSLSAKILKSKKTKDRKNSIIYRGYRTSLAFMLKFKWVLLITILGVFGVSMYLGIEQGFELMPAADEGQIDISIEMQKGTNFKKTSEVTDYIISEIDEIPEIDVLSADIGGGMMFLGGSNDSASITILLKDNRTRSSFEIADEVLDIYENIDFTGLETATKDDINDFTTKSSSQAMGGDMMFGGGINISIKGEDLYKMEEVANDLVAILSDIEGTKDHSNGIERTNDVVRLEVNKDNAIKRGLTEKDIMSAIEIFYQGLGFSMVEERNTNLIVPVEGVKYDIKLPAQEFNMGEIDAYNFLRMVQVFDYDVSNAIKSKLDEKDPLFALYLPNVPFFDTEGNIPNPNYEESIPIGALMINNGLRYDETSNEVYVVSLEQIMSGEDTDPKLSELAKGTIYDGNISTSIVDADTNATGFASINRDGKTRVITVSAALEKGYQQSIIDEEVAKKISDYQSTSGYKENYENIKIETEDNLMDTVADLAIAVVLAVLLVYMIMAIQFQSVVYPFIVLFTIPLAFTGAFLALVVLGLPISMPAMIGLIVLTGIIVNNGIVLIDYINQQREDGKTVREALFEAGQTRLRPIFMTALTTSLALFPMALGLGEGGELLQPLAITSIGGLVYATILTLWVVPALYDLLTRKRA